MNQLDQTVMKLELKYLVPYSIYGLTGLWVNGKNRIYKVTNICVSRDGNISFGHSLKTRYKHEINRPLSEFKPLLIPMWELTDAFVRQFDWAYAVNVINHVKNNSIDIKTWHALVAEHYDVFGLIEQGLALNKLEHGQSK
jgi:hypothetical protein